MKIIYGLILCAVIIYSCTEQNVSADLKKVKEDVIQTDLAFSKLSSDSGYQKAFTAYAANNMIRLNPRQYATFGRDQLIEDFKKEGDDTSFSLTWKPLHVEISDAGDLASAFGDWQIKTKLNGKDTILYGNYITVWKKQADGQWKFILDGGNPTPGPNDASKLAKLE